MSPTAWPPLLQYGAELATVPRLLEAARALGLSVRGVSFHVGSGAKNPAAFTAAIESARHVFDLGLALGFEMDTLDLGGGFCGGAFDAAGNVDLGGVPAAINAALDEHFPDPEGAWGAGVCCAAALACCSDAAVSCGPAGALHTASGVLLSAAACIQRLTGGGRPSACVGHQPCLTPRPSSPPPAGKLRIIAEPGRYFAEAFATYACFINGWRARTADDSGEQLFDYFLTDGLYGSMNW